MCDMPVQPRVAVRNVGTGIVERRKRSLDVVLYIRHLMITEPTITRPTLDLERMGNTLGWTPTQI